MKLKNKTEIQKYKDDLTRMFENEVKTTDDAKAVIQDIWEKGLTPNKELFDEVLTGSTGRTLPGEVWEVIDLPPKAKVKKVTVQTFDTNSPEFYDAFTHWDAKDKTTQSPLVDQATKNSLSIALGDATYRMGRTEWAKDKAGANLYEVENHKDKTLKTRKGNEFATRYEATSTFSNMIRKYNPNFDPVVSGNIYQRWSQFTDQLGKHGEKTITSAVNAVVTDLFPELYEDRWALYYSPHFPDENVECPNIKAVLNRMSEGEAVAALIWGIYSEQYCGRQILWLHGLHGNEGKSFFFKWLGDMLFGSNAGFKAIAGNVIKKQNSFSMSSFVGAKLIVYPDCNNGQVIQTEFAKILSGGGRDAVQIEEKYEAATTGVVDGRLIILANIPPVPVNEEWYMSRLMYSTIDPFDGVKDPQIMDKWESEINGFLYYAAECYTKLVDENHNEIRLKESTMQTVKGMCGNNKAVYNSILYNNFEETTDTTEYLSVKDIRDVLEVDGSLRNMKEVSDWLDWFDYTYAVKKVRDNKVSHRVDGRAGWRIKASASGGSAAQVFADPTSDADNW